MCRSCLNRLPSSQTADTKWPWAVGKAGLAELTPRKYSWPRISVVTPSYNQGQFLEQTIRSVLLQDYPNLEHIIIDGGSTDSSLEIIKKYSKYLAYWVSEPDGGQSDAINKGFAKATGEIFCWLNSDDYFEPGALRIVGQYFLDLPECKWLVGGCQIINGNWKKGKILVPCYDGQKHLLRFWESWKGGTFLPQQSSFFRRDLIKGNLVREDFQYAMDYDLWIRLSQNYAPMIVPEVLACYRMHQRSKTTLSPEHFFPEQLLAARPYCRRHGLRFTIQYEIQWRRTLMEKLFRKAFQLKHRGMRKEALKELCRAALCYPPCIFEWKVCNLFARLILNTYK